jgi:uncharacterized RDD family membrane protein YckC
MSSHLTCHDHPFVSGMGGLLALLWIVICGRSVGKQLLGLEIVDHVGFTPASRCTVLAREFLFLIFSGMFIFNAWSMFWGICCGGEFFHDGLVNTTVVRKSAIAAAKRK